MSELAWAFAAPPNAMQSQDNLAKFIHSFLKTLFTTHMPHAPIFSIYFALENNSHIL